MVNKWGFNYFGTSLEEIITHTKQEDAEYYLPKIDELSAVNEQLVSSNNQLISQNDHLKNC